MIEAGVLREIQDLETYYQYVAEQFENASPAPASERKPTSATDHYVHMDTADLDRLSERLIEVETLLAADEARKPKFQKPAKQDTWRREIEELWERIERLEQNES